MTRESRVYLLIDTRGYVKTSIKNARDNSYQKGHVTTSQRARASRY